MLALSGEQKSHDADASIIDLILAMGINCCWWYRILNWFFIRTNIMKNFIWNFNWIHYLVCTFHKIPSILFTPEQRTQDDCQERFFPSSQRWWSRPSLECACTSFGPTNFISRFISSGVQNPGEFIRLWSTEPKLFSFLYVLAQLPGILTLTWTSTICKRDFNVNIRNKWDQIMLVISLRVLNNIVSISYVL